LASDLEKGTEPTVAIGIDDTDGETSPNMPPKYPSVSPSIGPAGAQAGFFIGLAPKCRGCAAC
jgi:hypothetical protein